MRIEKIEKQRVREMSQFDSYKEENKAQQALDELKQLIQHGLNNHEFTTKEEISIWGVPLLCDKRTDVILLKFLRAKDFEAKETFTMIKNTLRWRKEFGVDDLIEEDLGNEDLENAIFMHGFDRESRPVCYIVYEEFRNEELYKKTFGNEEKRKGFIRWRVQLLEKCIRKLDFNPTHGISTIIEVSDLKNFPKRDELTEALDEVLSLFEEHYPEIVAKQVFINDSWWHRASSWIVSPLLSKRTKSKFVFVGSSKSVETLFKYIAPDQVPVMYREGFNKKV